MSKEQRTLECTTQETRMKTWWATVMQTGQDVLMTGKAQVEDVSFLETISFRG